MQNEQAAYLNTALSPEVRAADLVSRMTIEEAMAQMLYDAPAIERLGVEEYNWWNEALHGVARAGTATVFPQAIALAATFDADLIRRVADIIALEGRAKHHEAAREGDRDIYKGLTFWSPNINIFRDPRWGRGHETYGEDPWLTARLGVAFVRGLQGEDPRFLKTAACAKHYAVHSGPENTRHSFNAEVSEKDLRETYLPAFRALVVEAQVESVMGAYNRVNGEPACASKRLLEDILRNEWGFRGHVVSDCGAINDFHSHHRITPSMLESVALAVERGCDLNCGPCYRVLPDTLRRGLVQESWIRRSVERLMTARIKLGMFDPAETVPFAATPYEVVDCPAHREAALDASKRSLVLLKNSGVLPLDRRTLKTIAVLGPTADSVAVLRGNYCGTPSEAVTVLNGIREAAGTRTRILYAEGCHLYRDRVEGLGRTQDRLSEAVSVVKRADAAILCLGLDPSIEGEEGDASNEYAAGDKRGLELPTTQQALLRTVADAARAASVPLIVVVLAGSATALGYADEMAEAVVQAWYPGAQGGRAAAALLFGDYSSSARLPVTFYRRDEDLPDFDDYAMDGRTYRYFRGEALYPFGFGLSYSRFEYSALRAPARILAGEPLALSVRVKNAGERVAEETVQLYVSVPGAGDGFPIRELRGVAKPFLAPGEETEVRFELTPRDLSSILPNGCRVLGTGTYRISIGGHQGDPRSTALAGYSALAAEVEIAGTELALEY